MDINHKNYADESEEKADKHSEVEEEARKLEVVTGKINSSKRVTMSNYIVTAREKCSNFAFIIARLAIAQIPFGSDILPSKIKITKETLVDLGYTPQRITSYKDNIVDDLLNYKIFLSQFNVKSGEKEYVEGVILFTRASCDKNADLNLVLNPDLAPFFINLRKNFMTYSPAIYKGLPKRRYIYTVKLYELLHTLYGKYSPFEKDLFRLNLEDLIDFLDNNHQKAKKASDINNFITRNLKPAINDINQLTSMQVEYSFVRNGRRYRDIRFLIREWDNVAEKTDHIRWENDCHEGKCTEESKRIIEAWSQSCKQRLQTGEGEIIIEKIEKMD